MTHKEQNKILDEKIKANNAQYNLDRMNAEISAYSSGDLHKYEYLTKKDLGYKPDAFEKAKFEYSPLGKVFTDGLNKSDKNEGLFKRLKNIESKSNNQLLALKDINRPAIRGRDDDYDDDDDDDDDDDIKKEYKKIVEDYRNDKIRYEEIKEKLSKTIDATKIYEKNKKIFENIPNIESKMNKNKKFVKMLKKVVTKNLALKRKLLILHGLMIQNYLIKLTMMLLIDIVKTKIQLNYYLLKTLDRLMTNDSRLMRILHIKMMHVKKLKI